MSFLLSNKEEPDSRVLFSGDIILDTPSTAVEDFYTYMKTLYMLRDEEKYKFDYVCTTHSLDLSSGAENHIMIPGAQKLQEYIEYRETRLDQLLKLV